MIAGMLISGAAALGLLLPNLGRLSPLVFYHGIQMTVLYCIFAVGGDRPLPHRRALP